MSASNNSGKNDNKNIKNEIDWKIIDQLHNARECNLNSVWFIF
jgi:hypothetical protein